MNPTLFARDLEALRELGEDGELGVVLRLQLPAGSTELSPNDPLQVFLTDAQALSLADWLQSTVRRCVSEPPPQVAPAAKPRRSGAQLPAPFTKTQGNYLRFIHKYMQKYGCSPAESDIQRHFLVSAPSVNNMVQRLEALGFIARTPGQGRSIRLLVPSELLQPVE